MMGSIPAIWRGLSLLQRIGASVGLILALFAAWKLFWWQYDRGVIQNHETKITAQVIEASASASIAAVEAAAVAKSEVEKQNEQARKAADGSDDPLKSGLDRLRTGAR